MRDAFFHVNFEFLKSFESVFVATVVLFTKVEFNWIGINHFPPQPILLKQRMSCCNRTICHPLFLKMGLFLEIAVTRLLRKMEPCSVIRRMTREATLSERPTNHFLSFRARCEVGWWNRTTKPTKSSVVYIACFFPDCISLEVCSYWLWMKAASNLKICKQYYLSTYPRVLGEKSDLWHTRCSACSLTRKSYFLQNSREVAA
mgnify:FL=1